MARTTLTALLLACLALMQSSLARAQSIEDPYEVDDAALRRAAAALVEVHCLGPAFDEARLGFAYIDRSHALTSAARGRCDEAFYVLVDGERVQAHRSRVSDELGVSLLELETPLPAIVVPLVAEAFSDPVRGAPLAYFTRASDPVDYESRFGLVRTVVSGTDPLRFDARFSSGGAPVVDREGHLLGVCRPSWDENGFTSLAHIDDIEIWLGETEEITPRRRSITLDTDMADTVSWGRQDLLTAGLMVGVTTAFDRTFTVRGDLRLDLMAHQGDRAPDPPLGLRASSGLFVGLRTSSYLEDGPRMRLSLEVGAVGGYEWIPPSPGVVGGIDELFLRPAARLSASLGIFEVTYELQLDTSRPDQSVQLVQLGFDFD